RSRQLTSSQVHAVRAGRQRDVGAAVDQHPGCFGVLADNRDRLFRQLLQVARGEVLFANLDQVDIGSGRIRYAAQQGDTSLAFCSREATPVSDVIEQHSQ